MTMPSVSAFVTEAEARRPLAERPYAPQRDLSLYGILLANAVTFGAALIEHWPLGPLLWIYWGQSVIIGIVNVIRMLSLRDFSTEGLSPPSPPTPKTRRSLATFFAFHYGFFHLGYFAFLSTRPFGGMPGGGDALGVAVAIAAFGIAHVHSLRRNRGRDFRSRRPNIGALMFYPYLRIIPMHLVIIFGAAIPQIGLVLFILLKSLADVGMHVTEHALFQRQG